MAIIHHRCFQQGLVLQSDGAATRYHTLPATSASFWNPLLARHDLQHHARWKLLELQWAMLRADGALKQTQCLSDHVPAQAQGAVALAQHLWPCLGRPTQVELQERK